MYLFDTDTLSNVLKKIPSPLLLKKLEPIPEDLQFTTSINVSEIYFGAYRSRNRKKILKAYEDKVFPNLYILPFDTESGKIYGRLKARVEKKRSAQAVHDRANIIRDLGSPVQSNMPLEVESFRALNQVP